MQLIKHLNFIEATQVIKTTKIIVDAEVLETIDII